VLGQNYIKEYIFSFLSWKEKEKRKKIDNVYEKGKGRRKNREKTR
jgi:hypothetical protein